MPVPETIVMLEKSTKDDPILILDDDVDYGEGVGTAKDPIELKGEGEDAEIKLESIPETIVMLEKGTKDDPILILDEDVDYGEGVATAKDPIELKGVGEDAEIKLEE
jgi:hypothetical protein